MPYLGIRFIQNHRKSHTYTISPKTYLFSLTLGQLHQFQAENNLAKHVLWIKSANSNSPHPERFQPAIATELNTNPGSLPIKPLTYVMTSLSYDKLIKIAGTHNNPATNILTDEKQSYTKINHLLGHTYAHQVGPAIKTKKRGDK